jgi:HIV Tat-specific factor 1
MALELLDEGYLRIGCKISVTKAQFQRREGGEEEAGAGGEQAAKRSRPNISHAQVKVAQSISKQALAWNEDDDLGVSKKRALKIIVLEGMFDLEDVKDDKFMDELEADIVSECEKCGAIEKITVFSKNPRGIVIVKFGTAFAAQECVRILDGRFFGGRKIKAFFWDGKSNYSVPLSDAATAAAEAEDEERLKEFGDWLDHEQEDLPEELKPRVES